MTKWNEAFWLVESYTTFCDVHQLWLPVENVSQNEPKKSIKWILNDYKSYNKAYVNLFWVNMK